MFFRFLLCFNCSSIKKSIAEKSLFFSFHFLVFIFIFSSPFFCSSCLAKEIWWERTRHVTKRNEWKQWWEWPPRSEKDVSCWRDLSMTEALSWWTRIYQWKCIDFNVLARFGSNSAFLVIEWQRQPAGHPLVKACRHLLVFLSLCFFHPLYVYPLHSRRGKRLAERLCNPRRWSWTQRIEWSVSKIQGRSCQKNKNLRKDKSMTWKSKQAKWQIKSPRLSSTTKSTWRTTMKGSSLCPTKLGRRTSQTRLKERICQITEAKWMHPCNVLEGDNIHWTRMRSGLERWWSVGLMEETDGKMDTKRGQMKNTDETRPKSEKSSCSIYQWCYSRWCKNLS